MLAGGPIREMKNMLILVLAVTAVAVAIAVS